MTSQKMDIRLQPCSSQPLLLITRTSLFSYAQAPWKSAHTWKGHTVIRRISVAEEPQTCFMQL
jgi:hypothetical protein